MERRWRWVRIRSTHLRPIIHLRLIHLLPMSHLLLIHLLAYRLRLIHLLPMSHLPLIYLLAYRLRLIHLLLIHLRLHCLFFPVARLAHATSRGLPALTLSAELVLMPADFR